MGEGGLPLASMSVAAGITVDPRFGPARRPPVDYRLHSTMDAYLEVWGPAGAEPAVLRGERVVIGRATTNDIALADDPVASRVHAALEHYPSGWSIRDLGSANGTKVNGEVIVAERALKPSDEIVVGTTRLVFRAITAEPSATTVSATDRPPVLTRREHDVLVALCRPVMGPGPFAQPATASDIAASLIVSEATVKFHLSNLYDKFDIGAPSSSRRSRLAEAALTRGAVQRSELRDPGDTA